MITGLKTFNSKLPDAPAMLIAASLPITWQASIVSASHWVGFTLPVIIHNLLQSVRLLADGALSFEEHCARGIEADRERIAELVRRSLMLVTALNPHIGYDKAAAIAKRAHQEGSSLRDAALASGWLSAEEFDAWVKPEAMVGRTG